MSTSRRDLLKYFGAGALIAPAASGAPIARIIEPPRVELIEPPTIVQPFDPREVQSMRIGMQMCDGSVRTIEISHSNGTILGAAQWVPIAVGDSLNINLRICRSASSLRTSPETVFADAYVAGYGRLA